MDPVNTRVQSLGQCRVLDPAQVEEVRQTLLPRYASEPRGLAGELLLTASGVTRLLDGLEAAGFVERATCASDRRVVYAVLTDVGEAKLREAAESHVGAVRALFHERFTEDELRQLGGLLTRLPGAQDAADEACSP